MDEIQQQNESVMLDIGISQADAVAIKQTILAAVREGHVDTDPFALTQDLIAAFKRIDDEVFIRAELSKDKIAQNAVDKP